MSMNQFKKPDPGNFLEKLFDYISLCIYRYCYTVIMMWKTPQAIYPNGAQNDRCLTPSLFWLINLLLLELFSYNVGGSDIANVVFKHDIENHLYWPIYSFLSLFLGTIIFSLILTWKLPKKSEESYFLRILGCVQYASVFYLPYIILANIINLVFTFFSSRGLLVLNIFFGNAKASLQNTELLDVVRILGKMALQDYLMVQIGAFLSLAIWIGCVLGWGRAVYLALALKNSVRNFALAMIIMVGIALLPFGVAIKAEMGQSVRKSNLFINAVGEVKIEELDKDRNYLLLSYLCHYISQSIHDDEANQYKYELLSVLYRLGYIYYDLGYTDTGGDFSVFNTDVNSLNTCKLYLDIAKSIYKICQGEIGLLENEDKLGVKPGDTIGVKGDPSTNFKLENPTPNQDYSYYSSEMVTLKKRLDNLEELEKKVSAKNGDYIYPDLYIPVNQAYEIPVYARLSLAFFPFFFCF